ncbi:UNVERIFIED_CONTAM: putative mitochondrial protein [Sesamum angustifolium]|uniref:Mitochondrial protein n=1 Tax=Sesamum angustifolium TaxID=2727405 RepID=A0AAW2NWT4_9LAMI
MSKLLDFGFRQFSHDHCLSLKAEGNDFLALLVYVNDILLTGTSIPLLKGVKSYLDKLFNIKDLGHPKYFLGLELAHSQHGLHVSQSKFLRDILTDSGMLDTAQSISSASLIGMLPCTFFATSKALHHLVFFPSTCSRQLSTYSDASWASCHDSRGSITGYCIFLGTSLVSWKAKKQATVSRSTTEAEYRSMGSTVCELLWMSYLLRDFHIHVQQPISFWCDYRAALIISANPVFHECNTLILTVISFGID